MPFLDLYSKTEYKKLEAERDTALGMYDSLRLQFNEVDDAHVKTMMERDRLNEANAKLLGQVKELQGLCASLQAERDKLLLQPDEAHEQLAEKDRTIKQQQQIIDDMRKPAPRKKAAP